MSCKWRTTAAGCFLGTLCWGCLTLGGCTDSNIPGGASGGEDTDIAAKVELPPEVDPASEPLVKRADQIFDRIVRVYGRLPSPSLRVADIRAEPLAWATPEDRIVLSLGALRFCYKDVEESMGDVRLGFVLSHELAHLAGNHFVHLRLYETIRRLSAAPQAQLEMASLLKEADRVQEIEADEEGLVHLSRAGFEAGLLVDDFAFFRGWVGAAPTAQAFSGLSPDARVSILRGVVNRVSDYLPYFYLGTRLYQLGLYHDAQPLLETFERQFSDPSVLNNLGLCHYQIAARKLAECDGQLVVRFKLPTVLASSTILERLVERGGASNCLEATEFKNEKRAAENYFLLAQGGGGTFRPAVVNHLSLMLLSQDGSGALTRTFDLGHEEDIELLQLVGLYLRAPGLIDKPALIRHLESLRTSRPGSADVSYDLARILQESGQVKAAQAEWRRFLELEPFGPFADYVRQQLGLAPLQASGSQARPPSPPRPLGPLDENTKNWLARVSKPIPLRAENLELALFQNVHFRAVVKDTALVLVEFEPDKPTPQERIEAEFGPPLNRLETTWGEFLGYDGFGFDVENGKAKRIIHFQAPLGGPAIQ